MPDELVYAKAGVTPDAHLLRVIDCDTNLPVEKVVEVNVRQGWLVRAVTDAQGRYVMQGDGIARERIVGHFRLERKDA